MAHLWMIGALHYYPRWERRASGHENPPKLPEYPMVSVIVPCHNEAAHVEETISSLERLQYPQVRSRSLKSVTSDMRCVIS